MDRKSYKPNEFFTHVAHLPVVGDLLLAAPLGASRDPNARTPADDAADEWARVDSSAREYMHARLLFAIVAGLEAVCRRLDYLEREQVPLLLRRGSAIQGLLEQTNELLAAAAAPEDDEAPEDGMGEEIDEAPPARVAAPRTGRARADTHWPDGTPMTAAERATVAKERNAAQSVEDEFAGADLDKEFGPQGDVLMGGEGDAMPDDAVGGGEDGETVDASEVDGDMDFSDAALDASIAKVAAQAGGMIGGAAPAAPAASASTGKGGGGKASGKGGGKAGGK